MENTKMMVLVCILALLVPVNEAQPGGGGDKPFVYTGSYQHTARVLLPDKDKDRNATVSSAYHGWFWVPPRTGDRELDYFLYKWRIDFLGSQRITQVGVREQDGTVYHDTYYKSLQNGRSCANGVTADSLRGLNITVFLFQANQRCDGIPVNVTRPWSRENVLTCKCTLVNDDSESLYRIIDSDQKPCSKNNVGYPVRHQYETEAGMEIVTFETFHNNSNMDDSFYDSIFQRPSYCAVDNKGSESNPTVPAWVWIVVACGVCVILGVIGGFYIGQKKGKKIARERRPKRSVANDSHGGYNTALLDMM